MFPSKCMLYRKHNFSSTTKNICPRVHSSDKKFTWSELSAGSGCSSIGLGVHDEGKEVVEGVDDTETSTSSAINPCKSFPLVFKISKTLTFTFRLLTLAADGEAALVLACMLSGYSSCILGHKHGHHGHHIGHHHGQHGQHAAALRVAHTEAQTWSN